MTRVPFLDLRPSHEPLRDELERAFARTLTRSTFVLGPEVEAFEAEFAEYCNVRHCVGVGNGLDALKIILLSCGVGPGDEVIVPAHTAIATWLAVTEVGARPVGVDIEARSYNLDSALLSGAITPRTRAVIPVHLYGRVADMRAIRAVAQAHKLVVIEDAAQAHGASGEDGMAGGLGDAAAFSFYPTKNLGALGDGGAIVTNDADLAGRARAIRNYGSTRKNHHERLGTNSRLDELQAALLRVKLPRLRAQTQARRATARAYIERLDQVPGLTCPDKGAVDDAVWHLFVVQTAGRDALAAHLESRGIGTLVHYPIAPHRQPALAHLGYSEGSFPVAERAAAEVLSLPLWPGIAPSSVSHVCASVEEWFALGKLPP